MNLKTLLLMSVMSLTSMLMGSDSRSEEGSRQLVKSNFAEELKNSRIGQVMNGLIYEQPPEVKELSIKAGVLAMFSQTREDIAGAPSLAPTFSMEKNRWKAFVSLMPEFISPHEGFVFAGFRTTW